MPYNVYHTTINQNQNDFYQTNNNEQGNLHIDFDSKTNRFMMDGKSYTMMEMLYVVNSAAATRAKERLAIALQDLQDANDDAKAAVEWLNTLRNITPDPEQGYSVDEPIYSGEFAKAKTDFQNKYGFDPMKKYGMSANFLTEGVDVTRPQLDQITESTKSYMSTISDDQKAIGLDTERYTHRSEESYQFMASSNKSISDVISNIITRLS